MTSNVIRDIVYKEVNGQKLHLDLHLPTGEQSVSGIVVYFHGGGFAVGDRADNEAQRAQILAARGIPVATVQYRLLDVAKYPAQIEDAQSAIQWLRDNAEKEYGLSVSKVGVWGSSAGGTLAAHLALGSPRNNTAPDVDAAVIWFACLDFDAVTRGSALELALIPDPGIEALLGEPFDLRNEKHRDADPLHQVSAAAAPILLMSGDRDRIMELAQSERLHNSLVAVGAESSLWVIGGAGHEDDVFESPVVIGSVAEFFAHHLRKDS